MRIIETEFGVLGFGVWVMVNPFLGVRSTTNTHRVLEPEKLMNVMKKEIKLVRCEGRGGGR